MFLTCAVADAVVLGSEAFHFFIAFITFLFLSSLGISQFRKEESVPRGPCSVTGMCVICVVYCRARRWRKGVTMTCSVETPCSEER